MSAFIHSGVTTRILLVATLSGLIFTTWSLGAAVKRRCLLFYARINGNRRFLAIRQVRHEALRLSKHILMVYAAFITVMSIETLKQQRDIIISLVAFLLAFNSAWDLWDRHRGLQRYLESQEESSNEKYDH